MEVNLKTTCVSAVVYICILLFRAAYQYDFVPFLSEIAAFERYEKCDIVEYEGLAGRRFLLTSIMRDAEIVFPHWAKSIHTFVRCMQQVGSEVAVSIVSNDNSDNTSMYLRRLQSDLFGLGAPNVIVTSLEEGDLGARDSLWIDRLSRLRNVALRNANFFGGLGSFDVAVFMNDVFFEPRDIVRLAKSLSVGRPGTGAVSYDEPFVGAVCAMDFSASFYDAWTSHGMSGESFHLYYPYLTQFDGWTSFAQSTYHKRFQALSCWNGLMALDAKMADKYGFKFRTSKNDWTVRGYLGEGRKPAETQLSVGSTIVIEGAGRDSIGSWRENTLHKHFPGDEIVALIHSRGAEYDLVRRVTHDGPDKLNEFMEFVGTNSLYPLRRDGWKDSEAWVVKLTLDSTETRTDRYPAMISGRVKTVRMTPLSEALSNFECEPTCECTLIHKDMITATTGNYILLVDPKVRVFYWKPHVMFGRLLSDLREYLGLLEKWFVPLVFPLDRFSHLRGLRELPDDESLYSLESRLRFSKLMACRLDFPGFVDSEVIQWILYLIHIALALLVLRRLCRTK